MCMIQWGVGGTSGYAYLAWNESSPQTPHAACRELRVIFFSEFACMQHKLFPSGFAFAVCADLSVDFSKIGHNTAMSVTRCLIS